MQSQGPRKLAAPNFLNQCASGCRKLFYSALIAIPLLSYPCVSHAFPKSNPAVKFEKAEKAPTIRKSPVRRQSVGCRFEKGVLEYKLRDGTVKKVEDLLERNETVLDLACHERYAFAITSTSLIVVPGRLEKEKSGNVEVILRFTKKDLREMHKKGIQSWAFADDRCYFLSKNGELTEVPVIVKEETIPVYRFPFDFRGSAMVFHRNLLFIAPAISKEKTKVMLVLKLSGTKANIRKIALEQDLKDADFYYSGQKLFFGIDGSDSVEIKIRGTEPSDVRLIAKKRK